MSINSGVAPPSTEPVDPAGPVAQAIAAANYEVNGAPFAPLLIRVTPGFVKIWSTDNLSVYRQTLVEEGWGVLGDFGSTSDTGQATPVGVRPNTSMLEFKAMPGFEDALARPVNYVPRFGLNGIWIYGFEAPEGYVSVGGLMGPEDAAPNLNAFWCVKKEYVESVPTAPLWSCPWPEQAGDLVVPTFDPTVAADDEDSFHLAPQTMMLASDNAFALVLDKCFLPVTGLPVPNPPFDPAITEGQTTAQGLGSVAVVPASGIPFDAVAPRPGDSPFYYLAAQASWLCLGSYSTPAGGNVSASVTVGTSTSESHSFEQSTAVTVGADVGVGYLAFSAHFQVSYTHEMSVTAQQTSGNSTETTLSITIAFPDANLTLLWQRIVDLVVYRTDGSTLSDAIFQASDTRLTWNA